MLALEKREKRKEEHFDNNALLISSTSAYFIIKCECGKEILILPDLKATGFAIENHAAEHMKREKNPAKAKAEENRVIDALITKVLEKAGETCAPF